ncbi:NRDE family protein [Marinifilum sp.]|uniref:NRDE family protein n=1 Tax=Marinifilum sp. TaxID=2033137 RepID=UPI003BA93E25
MCTLTYIPLGENNFVFTTNRDEDPKRNALPPDSYFYNNIEYIFPKDKTSQGTWMLCSKKYSICLLNGAFAKHKHNPPYKMSRGLLVLEYANYKSVSEFVLKFQFQGIEPFTMLVLGYENKLSLEEIRWDGSSIHYKKLDAKKTEIWSSSTLYDKLAQEMRKKWFTDFNIEKDLNSECILRFHKNAGKEDAYNGLVMNRKGKIKTTSITQIVLDNSEVRMMYEDLDKNEVTERYFGKEKSLK